MPHSHFNDIFNEEFHNELYELVTRWGVDWEYEEEDWSWNIHSPDDSIKPNQALQDAFDKAQYERLKAKYGDLKAKFHDFYDY
jgi:hypothetical protein